MNETDKALVEITFNDLKEKMSDEMLSSLEFLIVSYLMDKDPNFNDGYLSDIEDDLPPW